MKQFMTLVLRKTSVVPEIVVMMRKMEDRRWYKCDSAFRDCVL